MLSEVTVLSRLNHPNVVRYFAAWIEDGVSVESRQSDSSEEETFLTSNGDVSGRVFPASSRGLDFISSAGANIVFGDDVEDDNPCADTTSEGDNEDDNTSDEGAIQCSDDSEEESEPALANTGEISPRNRSNSRETATWTILYIQMEYCKPEVGSLSLITSSARQIGQEPPNDQIIDGSTCILILMAGFLPYKRVSFWILAILTPDLLICHSRPCVILSAPVYKQMPPRAGDYSGKSFKGWCTYTLLRSCIVISSPKISSLIVRCFALQLFTYFDP